MSRKAVIITGENGTDIETLYPYYRLQEAGFTPIIATKDGQDTVGFRGVKIPVDVTVKSLKVEDYDMLVLPGGAVALEKIRQDQDVLDFIHAFNDTGKVIASICHGSQLLISAKIVKGRKVSGYYSIKDDLINAGGTYVDEPAVIDGNLVCTAHFKHMAAWFKAALDLAG